jgi:acyl-CoA reductase-like NAD-dependent aldehyde dehydrogenase
MMDTAAQDPKGRGWTVETFDGSGDMVAVNNQMNTYITRGFDALINIAWPNDQMTGVIVKAKKANIPFVLAFARMAPDTTVDIGHYDGQVYAPTILTDVPYSASVSNEETFGPVVIGEPVDSDEEAIAVANRVSYGLVSSILTKDTYRGLELAPKVLAGVVNVNSSTVNDETHVPMGGVRDSGWGRTGPESLKDFSDVIWINARSTERTYPF